MSIEVLDCGLRNAIGEAKTRLRRVNRSYMLEGDTLLTARAPSPFQGARHRQRARPHE